jgi:hypothetical protein
MKRIIIELDNNGNSKTEIKLEEMQPIHYAVFITELESTKLRMIGQRSKMTNITK